MLLISRSWAVQVGAAFCKSRAVLERSSASPQTQWHNYTPWGQRGALSWCQLSRTSGTLLMQLSYP